MDTLIKAADDHCLARKYSKAYRRQIVSKCSRFYEWSTEPVTVAGLTDEPALLSRFLVYLEDLGLSSMTVRGYRACILAVCHGVLGVPSIGPQVRRVRRSCPPPVCWTMEELRALLAVAGRSEGKREDSVPWASWWPAMIHAGYSTGQRFSDLLAIEASAVLANGRCQIVQSKTGKPIVICFSPETLDYCREFPANRKRFLPWCYSVETFRKRFQKLVEAAEIRAGSFKWLRRCAGSHLEAVMPGAGHRLLGNTRQVFEAHYNDLSVSVSEPLQAPSLTQ